MARLTNEHLHNEIQLIKQNLDYMKDNQEKLQGDISMIKKKLLNPDDGTIARSNKNTEFRKSAQKAIWGIWAALISIIGKMIFWD